MLLALQELEAKSLRKSYFLWEEHDWMEREAAMSWQIDELEHQLESTHRESKDRVAEVTGARAVELLTVERATAAEQRLAVAKVHLTETEAALQKSLETL